MRKISLVLAALMGLSGVAYGADWVQIGKSATGSIWVAHSREPNTIWEKLVWSTPQHDYNTSYDEMVSLEKIHCAQKWVRDLQVVYYLNGKEVTGSFSPGHPVYAAPGSVANFLLYAICRK